MVRKNMVGLDNMISNENLTVTDNCISLANPFIIASITWKMLLWGRGIFAFHSFKICLQEQARMLAYHLLSTRRGGRNVE